MSAPEEKVRYAVVGLGHIGRNTILPAFAQAERAKIVALFSGSAEKREQQGQQYGVPAFSYEELERGLAQERIEAVFVAVPNHRHREFTLRSIAAGVPVLCEKPLAMTVAEADEMIAAARAHRVPLMVAYRLHYAPGHREAMRLAHAGAIGEVRSFHSVFTVNVAAGNVRTRKAAGGGPLLDIGIYCIRCARELFQEEPWEVLALTARRPDDERFAEVDETCSVVMQFSQGRVATFTCAFGSSRVMTYDIVGTKGRMHLDPVYDYRNDTRFLLAVDGQPTEERTLPKGAQFAAEMDAFAQCIREGREPELSGQEGRADLRVIEAIEQSAADRCPVELTA